MSKHKAAVYFLVVISGVLPCTASAESLWTWVSGSDAINQVGVYGTKGVAEPNNIPGSRGAFVSWTDAAGNLWLFGGYGYGDVYLNDLWKFDGANWTWVSGSSAGGQYGVYGTKGVADPCNVPGARYNPVSWRDASGNLWLFGGTGYAASGGLGYLNDLWKFDGANWTWVSGSNFINEVGIYGTKGVANPTNVPGSRDRSVSWTDASGNLWLFGGWGYPATVINGYLNDLWKFDGTSWTWVSGLNAAGQYGVYGTKGVAASGNVPGARYESVSWIDGNGKLWLFGGRGYTASGSAGNLNDLWKFDGTRWTWVSGSNTTYQYGVYGTKGVAASGNVPGARQNSISWTDAGSNLWLFGGDGRAASSSGNLNDLWKFDGANWTWVSGSDVTNQVGVYGTKGVAASDNVPGARNGSVSWRDAGGNLWLFGGTGYAASGSGYLNDLWKFGSGVPDVVGMTQSAAGSAIVAAGLTVGAITNSYSSTVPYGNVISQSPVAGSTVAAGSTVNIVVSLEPDPSKAMWTWVSGSTTINQVGVYGTKGVPASGNVPGARQYSVSWTDAGGNFWFFGGHGYAASGINGYLNDLWEFDGDNWTWISGSNTTEQPGVYGTKGVAAPGNIPGARGYSVSWRDASGNLWLFGGSGYAASSSGYLNDLWKFDGTNWTWVSGSNTIDQSGVYGTKGVAASGNIPGARYGSVSWIDAGGNLWLFGGWGNAASGSGYLNDLWKFDGTNWTWVSGSTATNQFGVYGTKGIPASGNMPGARRYSVSWIDSIGNLWLYGGHGYVASGSTGYLNDLWKFDGTNWMWVSGSDAVNQIGVYGPKGEAASDNVPGARYSSVSWMDTGGNLWLFGGYGYAAGGGSSRLNDLWNFSGTNWTWVSGSTIVNQVGVYGTMSMPDSNNVPGTRYGSVSWIDSAGNLWLFTGQGYAASGSGYLNDLWKFGIPEKAADTNGDGIVNYLDLLTLIDQWLTNPTAIPSADIAPSPSGDDFVDFRDFAFLVRNWMQSI